MFPPPYNFDAQNADVILRSPLEQGSDQFRDFRVHKTILSIASIFFNDMFSLPQPPQPAAAGITLPIVEVTESAEIFEVFLRFIYPVGPPAITSLQLVDDLFQIADKYLANGVQEKLKLLLTSSRSFLRDDPIWVYALACRANFDEGAELAIPLTFKMDPVRGIPLAHLQMMTAEEYNRLLVAHDARRSLLLSAVSGTAHRPYPEKCSCGAWFYTRAERKIKFAIWERPFLDRERFDSCLPESASRESKCGLQTCRVSEQAISKYFTNILEEIERLG